MNGASVRMHTLQTLFDTTLENVADHARAQVALPLTLTLGNGRQFAAFVRSNWLAWSGLKAAQPQGHPPSAAPTQPAEAASSKAAVAAVTRAAEAAASGSALARLRTGAPQIEAVLDKIHRVLDRDIPILILGETGTGKEMLARAIHADSARCRQPFVAVNCASIPETLIEAELFGYDEGAFTGARRKGAPGRILQANGGTLFLDEIGDMPLALQARLLRVLSEREVLPVGATRPVPVNIRVIAATHAPLEQLVLAGRFRDDLYYRLTGAHIELPPLRERSDLGAMITRLLGARSLTPAALQRLLAHRWPGNLRELRNAVDRWCLGVESLAPAQPVLEAKPVAEVAAPRTSRRPMRMGDRRRPCGGSPVWATGPA
jgi:transcriptional regulator with PAS, ATPase and Fis domain